VLPCVAVCCSVLQCVAVCCKHVPVRETSDRCAEGTPSRIVDVDVRNCSVLQCVAVCCGVLR